MKTFQIEQNYGDGCLGFLYFSTPESATLSKIEKQAIETTIEDWKNVIPGLYFSAPKPCRPTIKIFEYKDGKKVKGGIQLKTKWR